MGLFILQAQTIVGKVVKVTDGDTFTLLTEAKELVKIRMYGIDAPEKKGGQPFSEAARKELSNLIGGQIVTVKIINTDQYGRKVGVVSTTSIKDINLLMIQKGLVWHYSYFDNTPEYIEAEKMARKQKIGLWVEKNPINPYEWRKKR